MSHLYSFIIVMLLSTACSSDSSIGPTINDGNEQPTESDPVYYSTDQFVMGADLSYVNQILDHGGTYSVDGEVENPYKIFADHGTNVVRLRLWHNPQWVQDEVYEDPEKPLYSGFEDVKKGIEESKTQGMAVNLDFHYSDIWADPSHQDVPAAWMEITDIEVLKDSVYNYTYQTLEKLNDEGLMPEFVQIGNETNCGMMFTNAPENFPSLNGCNGNWENLGAVINSGIQAVREISANSETETKIILHIAQPENAEWWFENITADGGVSDFDIIGLSYYSQFSDTPLSGLSSYIQSFRTTFEKEVMIVETAYPWTLENADNYTNIFGENSVEPNYPATNNGQLEYLTDLTRAVIDGGGSGVMVWEPAWITSNMKDLWGTGSSWENNAFFDFNGELEPGY
ncbi:glycoside hydrolase family 53 protein [Rhodohalobacter sp.]|uniref:glycoside hydrolase family 53 protein n=1 Tax=Rhodohalobacter sp. TaxID=1974210 RepID=UPI002ACD8B47|nr:glycosyl hydrolase 53 family protein [Rhodohalobacter sp.]MDZ7758005.1 glycosyl hydrolase 53 family protein [Rhodohalobacter sp.]